MTPEKKKKIGKAALLVMMILMLAYMAFDSLTGSNSTPPPISSSVVEPNHNYMDEPASLVPTPKIEEQSDIVPIENAYAPPEPQTTIITYQPSQKAKDVLDALEATYISKVNTDKLTAQIAEKKEKQSLDAMQPQSVVEVIQPPVMETTSMIDSIQVKSIVVTPKRSTAWLSVNDENIPVQYGVWVGDVRVVNITKDFVRFVNKNGAEFTKHVPSSAVIQTQQKGEGSEPF